MSEETAQLIADVKKYQAPIEPLGEIVNKPVDKVSKKTKKNPKGAGRKWFDGKDIAEIKAKLETMAGLDASLEETLLYADISEFSYYRYLKAHPNFAERLRKLRNRPVLRARIAIVKNLNTYQNAMDYMRRKRKDEFGDNDDDKGVNINFNFTLDEQQLHRIARRISNGPSQISAGPSLISNSDKPTILTELAPRANSQGT